MWNENAWQANLLFTNHRGNINGCTSATDWRFYQCEDPFVFVFLNSSTAEMFSLRLTEDERGWLLHSPTLAAPTERLKFYHGQ